MKKYKCDRCNKLHKLKQRDIIEMEYYVSPSGCFEGDYYKHDHFFFYCTCFRAIEVRDKDVTKCKNIPIIKKMHGTGRCIMNII